MQSSWAGITYTLTTWWTRVVFHWNAHILGVRSNPRTPPFTRADAADPRPGKSPDQKFNAVGIIRRPSCSSGRKYARDRIFSPAGGGVSACFGPPPRGARAG